MCDGGSGQEGAGAALGMFGGVISSLGKGRTGRANWRNRKLYAEINERNAKKAYYDSLKDLTARGLQEAGIIANNAEGIASKLNKRAAIEGVSAGESNVVASKMDNIRAALKTDVNARRAALMSRRNINSMATQSHVAMESRVNQGWSQVGAPPPGFGLGDFLSLGGALLKASANA